MAKLRPTYQFGWPGSFSFPIHLRTFARIFHLFLAFQGDRFILGVFWMKHFGVVVASEARHR